MTISIFNYTSYKEFIEAYVHELGEPWGYWAKLAKAILCQPAYLSRCMKDKTHLTVDQILALSRYWSLSSTETEYLIHLLEFERAGTEESRAYFSKRLNQLKEANENLKTRFKKDSFESIQDQALYYSSWTWMAIHFASSIKSLQTLESLSARFHIAPEQLQFILEKLASLGLVAKEGDRWIFNRGEFHLGKDSPLSSVHHLNWRTRAVEDSQNTQSDGIHYSALYTLSENDYLRLKAEIFKWIEASRDIVAKSEEEEIVGFNLDFFRL